MRYIIVFILLFGCAFADPIYHNSVEIENTLDVGGDITTSGTIVGNVGGKLVLKGSNTANELYVGGSEVFADNVMYPSIGDDFDLGTSTYRFGTGYFRNLDIDNILSVSSANLDNDLNFFKYSYLINDEQSIVHTMALLPGTGDDPPTSYSETSKITFVGEAVTLPDKGTGNIEFWVKPTGGLYGTDASLVISGDDDITANVAINAEGGVYVGGTEVISPSNADKFVKTDVADAMTARLDFTAINLRDVDISDTLTIGSGGDLSAPPAIGGTTPSTAAFTVTTTPEITSGSVMDLKSPSVSGSDAFRFGYGNAVLSADTDVSFYNDTDEVAKIDLLNGNFDTEGEVTSDSLYSTSSQFISSLVETLSVASSTAYGHRLEIDASSIDIDTNLYSYLYPSVFTANLANGDYTTPTVVVDTDTIFSLIYKGYDGTDYETAAYISATIDGTPGSNDMPGALNFYTTPNGSATPVLALEVDNAQGLNSFGVVTIDETSKYSFDASATNTQTYIDGYGNTNIVDIQRAQGTSSSKTIVANGNSLGVIRFNGYDGSAYQRAAYINVTVNGAPGSSDMPGKIAFGITPDGSASALIAMEITEDGVDITNDLTVEAITSGTTVIVNSSNEVLVSALEDSNDLSSVATWTGAVKTDVKGVVLDSIIAATGTIPAVSGSNQTLALTSSYMEITATFSASIDSISGVDYKGQELTVVNTTAATITFNDSLGNIDTLSDSNIVLGVDDWIKFFWDGTNWREINHKI